MTVQMQDIEAELSYAYLHAVASKAGFECATAGRLSDNHGIDAMIRVLARLDKDSILTDFDMDIQLKATTKQLPQSKSQYSYSLPIGQYDKLRADTAQNQKLLVVLLLPPNQDEWLSVSAKVMKLHKCAYWVSLRGACEIHNQKHVTVYLPKKNIFSPDQLREIATIRSREEYLTYAAS